MAEDKKKTKYTLDDIVESTNKSCGVGTMFPGSGLPKDPPRIPFGVFTVDFATGGGIPLWGTAGVWGPEGGGKSSLATNVMAASQRICWKCFNLVKYCDCSRSPLLMDSVWLDAEGTLDREWSTAIGADPDRYHIVLADYGEMYANIADNALRADDCGLVIVDSLAALTPEVEMDKAAEDDFYALQARLIGRMVRKLKQQLIRQRKRDHPCAIILVNQMRSKIGVKFGSPETMSGGHALKHEFSLLLRCVKKSLTDSDKIFKETKGDLAARHAFSIRKEKCLTLSGAGEFVRLRVDVPDVNGKKGGIYDYGTVLNYAKEYDIVRKNGSKGWKFFNVKAKKLDQIKELWRINSDEYYRTQMEIVKRAKARLQGENDADS
jgi:recombination protein RecA